MHIAFIKKVLKKHIVASKQNVLENIPNRSTKREMWMTLMIKEKKSVGIEFSKEYRKSLKKEKKQDDPRVY